MPEVGIGVGKYDSSLLLFNESNPQRKDTYILSAAIWVLKLYGENREMDIGRQPAWFTTKGKVEGLEMSVKKCCAWIYLLS